jgi:predicted RNase H-like HicB family nuclease
VSVKVGEVIKLLEEHGWRHVRTTGSFEVETAGLRLCRANQAICPPRHVSRYFEANRYRGIWTMIRKYSLVIEGDPTGYSAYVPELPAILVTGHSLEELTARATEAIQIYWDSLRADRSPTSTVREIEVDLPA